MKFISTSIVLLSTFYLCQIVALVDLALPSARLMISKNNKLSSPEHEVLSDIPNTDVVVDTGSNIVLACNATYPVLWIYKGNGVIKDKTLYLIVSTALDKVRFYFILFSL